MDDPVVDAVARTIDPLYHEDSDRAWAVVGLARDIVEAIAGQGHAVVPAEPTEAMKNALAEGTAAGMAPEEVWRRVLDAVRNAADG